MGNTLISKYGYYLVRGESHDKQYIKKVLDSFVNKNRFIDGTNYANYLLFFYKESEALNEEIVQSEEEKYRYKLFVHREGMIASYYIRDSAVFDITWGDEYK